MPDSKITALTALTAADPAVDMFPVVDVSDTTMAASGTTKRISINNILACSPVATLASATITGALDAARLNVTGSTIPANGVYLGSANNLSFSAASTLAMTLNATGLGVGISPIYKLHVKSDLSELYFRDNGTASELLINSETGGRSALYFGDVADSVRGGIVYDSATDSLEIRGYNNVARLQIDSVGNVVSNVTATAPTLSTNSQMVFNLTSNTNLRISVRGTDGVTRTANITLA